jgi:hypothetical protein
LQEFYSEIYFVTPHWNPSVEAQAVARCHRMGQTRQVVVFRFLMEGTRSSTDEDTYTTFDSYVTSVQDKKREVACAVGLG